MCKLATVTNVNDNNRTNVWLFMQILGQYISHGNDDGLGYAAFDKSGKIFGEKWLINKTAFRDFSQTKGLTATKTAKLYSFFGDKVLRDEARAIILHTRAATCGKSIENTHPFVDNIDNPTIATIHNGVIYNDNEFEKKFSTCDSEVLVHLYKDHDVTKSLENINSFSSDLMGWYTVLNLATQPDGRLVMDAYTDNGRLESLYIEELGTRVYASSASDIKLTADFLGFKTKEPKRSRAMTGFRLDVITGEMIESIKIKERPKLKYKGDIISENGNFDDEDYLLNWFNSRK